MNKPKYLYKTEEQLMVFDERLEQFRDKNLFPEKLEQAKEILTKYGLPKNKK